MLSLLHFAEYHLEGFSAQSRINNIVDEVDTVVHAGRTVGDVREHGRGCLELAAIFVAVFVVRKFFFVFNQDALAEIIAFVSAKLQEVVLQDAADDVHHFAILYILPTTQHRNS